MFKLFSKPVSGPGPIRTLRDLQEWLEDLPPLDLDRSIASIVKALQETRNQATSPRKCMPMLHAYRAKTLQIVEPSYSAPRTSDATSKKLDHLLEELASAYQSSVSADDVKMEAGCDFCTALYCSMEMHIHRLLLAYRGYGTPPWGGHHQVHELMRLAEASKVLYQPVLVDEQPTASESVGKLYKQYLLLTLADPYHMGHGEVYPLFKLLFRYVQDLALRSKHGDLRDDTLFAINLTSDQIAVPAAKLKTRGDHTLYLDLSKVISSISRDRINEDASPRHRRYFESGRRLLEQILPRFRTDQKRREGRFEKSGPVAVVYGIQDLYLAMRRQLPVTLPDPGTQGLEVVMDDEPAPVGIETWQVLNQSVSGLRLSCLGRIDRLRVGNLIGLGQAVGQSAGTPVQAALIRWMRRQDNNLIHLGVQLLPGDLTACAFRDGRYGILLKRPRMPLVLLAEKNQLSPAESLPLKSKKPFVLHTRRILIRTSYLDGLSCEIKTDG